MGKAKEPKIKSTGFRMYVFSLFATCLMLAAANSNTV